MKATFYIMVFPLVFSLALAAISSGQGRLSRDVTLPAQELVQLGDLILIGAGRGLDSHRWRYISFSTVKDEDLRAKQDAVLYALATLSRTKLTERQYLSRVADHLWAIDTVGLGWESSVWDSFARAEQYYMDAGNPVIRDFFQKRTGSRLPILRHDEFLNGCWEPARYVAALAVPKTKDEFIDAFIGKNPKRQFGVVSQKLTVSTQPGRVARFVPGPNQFDLGPVYMRVLTSDASGRADPHLFPSDMDGDHTEFIWRLPDGMFAFTTYDKTGRLALSVSTDLSRDKDGKAVRLAISCIECHTSGPRGLDHADDPADLLLVGLNPAEFDREALVADTGQDQRNWAAALKGINGLTPARNVDGVRRTWEGFRQPIGSEDVVRELGLPAWRGYDNWPRSRFGEVVSWAGSDRLNRVFMEAAATRFNAAK